MKILHAVHPDDFKKYDTALVRERFLLDDIAQIDVANFVYTHYDRMVIGAVVSAGRTVELPNDDNLKANYFLERREMGIINVGADGIVTAFC